MEKPSSPGILQQCHILGSNINCAFEILDLTSPILEVSCVATWQQIEVVDFKKRLLLIIKPFGDIWNCVDIIWSVSPSWVHEAFPFHPHVLFSCSLVPFLSALSSVPVPSPFFLVVPFPCQSPSLPSWLFCSYSYLSCFSSSPFSQSFRLSSLFLPSLQKQEPDIKWSWC